MLSRRLLISTCAFSLIASPALPQTTTAQRATAPFPNASQLAPAPSLREVLRTWGLDRPSRDLQFRKGQVTDERAAFSALVILDDEGKRSTLDNLVITRNNVPGPTFGYLTITADKFDDTEGTRIGRMTFSGIRGGANFLSAFDAVDKATKLGRRSRTGSATTNTAFVDSISMSDVTTTIKDDEEPYTAKFGQIEVTNLSFDNNLNSLGAITVKDSVFDFKQFSAKFASAELSGLPTDLINELGQDDAPDKPFDILSFALGRFSMSGLSYTFKGENGQAPPLNTMTLANLSIDNVKDGFIGKFSLSGLKMNGGVGAAAFEAGLDRFEFGDLNMRYFSELGTSMATSFAQAAASRPTPPPAPSTPGQNKAAPVAPPPSKAVTPKAATPTPVAPRPRVLMKDLLKGGPLDSGMRSFDMAGLSVSAAGYAFTMDRFGLTQVRNSDDIVTKADLIPSTWRFSWPAEAGSKTGAMSSLFGALGTDHISMRFSGGATFAPQTDRLSFDNYETEVVNWGKVRFDFAMTGLNKLMSEVSLDDIAKASIPEGPTSAANPTQQLQQIFTLYKSVTINSARAELFDLGGLDLAAKIFAGVSGGSTAPRTALTPAQKRSIRDGWGASFRDASGDKTKPALERQFSIALARWLETGGSLIAEVNPPAPLPLSTLVDESTISPTVLGLRVSNRPPTAPATR